MTPEECPSGAAGVIEAIVEVESDALMESPPSSGSEKVSLFVVPGPDHGTHGYAGWVEEEAQVVAGYVLELWRGAFLVRLS